jgi:putative SOS response-associated peptidase YedK
MCGRITLTRSALEVADYFALLCAEEEPAKLAGRTLEKRFNISPGQEIPVVRLSERGERTLDWRRWGLVPAWSKTANPSASLFNARSETAATKPSFRSAFRSRRCLVPASGFYEWTPRGSGHQPFYFEPVGEKLLALAGLYESWRGEGGEVIDSCTLLTTEASPDLDGIHHRMPVLLAPKQFSDWLDPATQATALEALLAPAPVGTLKRRPVSPAVNDARFDDPRCLEDPPPPAQESLFPPDG